MPEDDEKKMTPEQMIALICQEDGRYSREAYVFLSCSMAFTVKRIGEKRHFTAAEVVKGICEFAKLYFGQMASFVFQVWGINDTSAIGNMVFNFVDRGYWGKTEDDKREDFDGVLDLMQELEDYEIEVPEENGA